MIYSAIFAEGGLGSDFIYVIIGIIAAIGIAIGVAVTIITFIYNSITNNEKTSKYYFLIFGASFLIGLLVTGMICSSSI